MSLKKVASSIVDLPVAGLKVPSKSTVFSAIQPTGVFHLGNYLGAVRSWVDIASEAPPDSRLIFATADLHALTVPKDPAQLRVWRNQALASIVASGIDPERCIVYHQSQVPEHAQLYWIISTITGMGYLNRMVQWKSKSNLAESSGLQNMPEAEFSKLQLGLFAYPALQIADILLHKANLVPVGEDQSQHLELTRYVTSTFNHRFCPKDEPLFPTPSTLFAPYKKIASLRDPSKKMSKSDPDQRASVYITDSPDTIRSKVFKAVTDSVQGPITYDPINRPGVANLILIGAGLLKSEPEALVQSHLSHCTDHKQFKEAITEIVISSLSPVRDHYLQLASDHTYIESLAKRGAERAKESAAKTLAQVNELVGL